MHAALRTPCARVEQCSRLLRSRTNFPCWQLSPPPHCHSQPGRAPWSASAIRACSTSPVVQTPRRARLFLPDATHTYRLGELLGRDARAGDVLLLTGGLGAGKTSMARGFIHAARQDYSLDVTSPTYLLANSYPPAAPVETAPTVVHMDLWRLQDATKRAIVDFDNVFSECASLIEWPDRLGTLVPDERLEVLLEYRNVDIVSDPKDPWGFGNPDEDGIGSARDGRFASFIPFGHIWEERLQQLYKNSQMDQEGRVVLVGE